ncbi:MAG: hypothetical protein WC878_02560 [Candidatus Paceibacterota bacterium]|jgi:hypothetical protein
MNSDTFKKDVKDAFLSAFVGMVVGLFAASLDFGITVIMVVTACTALFASVFLQKGK